MHYLNFKIGVKICVYIYKCALNSKCKNGDQQNVNITQVNTKVQEISRFNVVFFHYNKKLQATCHINFLHILQYFFMKYFLFGCWIMFSWQAIMMIYLQTCYEVLTCTLLDYVLLASNHDKLTCQS